MPNHLIKPKEQPDIGKVKVDVVDLALTVSHLMKLRDSLSDTLEIMNKSGKINQQDKQQTLALINQLTGLILRFSAVIRPKEVKDA